MNTLEKGVVSLACRGKSERDAEGREEKRGVRKKVKERRKKNERERERGRVGIDLWSRRDVSHI